jgi:hypothetical protein
MVIFAAGKNKKLLTFHSFKNAGGTLLCPDNKLMCLLGTGASTTTIEVNFKELVANCNLVTPTIEELSKCKTASKVSELEAPNKTGLVTYPGSASFLVAPLLVNSVMAANSSDPFHLIAVVNAVAKTFDKEHDADAEYITKATDNVEDFILWAWGVGAGRVTKTSLSIDPNNTDLKPFKTQCHQACILTVGAAWTVPNGLPPLLQGDQTNLAVLGLLNTAISRQLDQQEEQNKILEKQVNHMIDKENSSKNRVKNLHEATIKMILFASAMDNEEVPDDVTDSCKRFMNSKSVAFAEQELNPQFETRGMNKVSFTTGYTANMYAGSFLWSSGDTPSNHLPFAFSEVEPIKAAEHKNHQLTLQLVLTQGRGLTLNEIKASNKQKVSAPMNFNEMKEQVQLFTIANSIFCGDLSVRYQSLRALLRMMENNKSTFKARECTDKKFPAKFLFGVDSRFQLWLKDCRKATSQNEDSDSLINFSALI